MSAPPRLVKRNAKVSTVSVERSGSGSYEMLAGVASRSLRVLCQKSRKSVGRWVVATKSAIAGRGIRLPLLRLRILAPSARAGGNEVVSELRRAGQVQVDVRGEGRSEAEAFEPIAVIEDAVRGYLHRR